MRFFSRICFGCLEELSSWEIIFINTVCLRLWCNKNYFQLEPNINSSEIANFVFYNSMKFLYLRAWLGNVALFLYDLLRAEITFWLSPVGIIVFHKFVYGNLVIACPLNYFFTISDVMNVMFRILWITFWSIWIIVNVEQLKSYLSGSLSSLIYFPCLIAINKRELLFFPLTIKCQQFWT